MKRRRIKRRIGKNVIKKSTEDYATVKCAFCKGRGVDPFPVLSPISTCPVCNGKGAVQIRKPYNNCPACEGTGVYIRSHLYCWTCKGKGVVYTGSRLTGTEEEKE